MEDMTLRIRVVEKELQETYSALENHLREGHWVLGVDLKLQWRRGKPKLEEEKEQEVDDSAGVTKDTRGEGGSWRGRGTARWKGGRRMGVKRKGFLSMER
jgi:hypothetical protein